MATEQAIQQHSPPSPRIRVVSSPHAMIAAAGLGLVLLVIATWAVGGFSAIRTAYAYMRGEAIFVDSYSKSFGSVHAGDPITVSFRLTNVGDKPVRFVGCRAYCGCVVPDDLPFTINPNDYREFTLSVRTFEPVGANSTESFSQPVILYTTSAAQLEIPLTIKGEIRTRSSPAGALPRGRSM
jgi:Protein of unknown function (DUF1573)